MLLTTAKALYLCGFVYDIFLTDWSCYGLLASGAAGCSDSDLSDSLFAGPLVTLALLSRLCMRICLLWITLSFPAYSYCYRCNGCDRQVGTHAHTAKVE